MALLGGHRTRLLVGIGTAAIVLGIVATVLVVEHSAGSGVGRTDAAGLPTGPITGAFIDSRPDAHLEYPGAVVLSTVVNPEGPTSCSIDGCSADQAYVDVWTATTASAATVRDWYRAELLAQGYGCVGSVGPDYAYVNDSYGLGSRQYLVVSLVKRNQYNVGFLQRVPADRTIVETQYSISETRYATFYPQVPAMCSLPLPSPTISSPVATTDPVGR
ncbi:MAG: hypothetical protein DLM65_05535 [Candidatus Aeolococcus gillhamiae]|uniref:Uncharacterized protein n=1 Tax=Candidatus Aeolococcus gillhamiae TaxID=3127015 RepID=A0A2W6ADQ7_9BACT|nr:MAG: hypothetical protein DLM65_05535 [Candidatus Dormibacter sp. RRmetagenome_bin12]